MSKYGNSLHVFYGIKDQGLVLCTQKMKIQSKGFDDLKGKIVQFILMQNKFIFEFIGILNILYIQ